jgi:hypothetical protein
MTRFRAASRATRSIVVVSVAFAVAILGLGVYALAAQPFPAPTISAAPANPTNQTSATFTYTDKNAVTRFDCSLDGAAFGACGTSRPSTKTYAGPLAPGSHTFQVRAVSGSQTSDATSYSWTIDTAYPFVTSITRAVPDPTNASSVSWTVGVNENLTGVDASDFVLANGGLGGAAISGVSSSGAATYTVTANTGSGSGTLGLNLVDNDSIRDLAGNRLGGTGNGNGNFAGPVYTIDRIAPPAPLLTQTPPDPSSQAESTFAWTDSEADLSFQCSIDNSTYAACASPYTFTVATNSNGTHQFAVRAADVAGNRSGSIGYSWKVSDVSFTITGNLSGLLYPGTWRELALTIVNPNHYPIYITSLSVSASSSPAGCPASTNVEFQQSPLSTSHTFAVPAQSSAPLPAADRPLMRLKNLPVNQDVCKFGTFGLTYGGSATK